VATTSVMTVTVLIKFLYNVYEQTANEIIMQSRLGEQRKSDSWRKTITDPCGMNWRRHRVELISQDARIIPLGLLYPAVFVDLMDRQLASLVIDRRRPKRTAYHEVGGVQNPSFWLVSLCTVASSLHLVVFWSTKNAEHSNKR